MDSADSPEQVPERFAAAWNAGDADALAALFAEDADFVNVVGLWWHDRENIRRAHEYGLRVIFPGSRMAVRSVRVRRMGRVAVVHCRWRLRGQRLPGGGRGEPRTGVMSFVAQERDGWWIAVSAHNTDVVPGAESIAASGTRRRPADYRG